MIGQFYIFISGMLVAFLVTVKNPRRRRWAYIIGLSNTPFWIWTAWEKGQWGVFGISCWYCLMHSRGIWTHFRKDSHAVNRPGHH